MDRFLIAPLIAALALVLAGCLPANLQDATPDAAVIGVPAAERIPAAADGLHERLAALPTGHDLVARSGLEFLEVRSGLTGSRVRTGAARIARNSGAEVAVTVGARRLEREIVGPPGAPREEVELQLEVTLIRTADASEIARLAGPRLIGERRLDVDEVLPDVAQDPLVRDLAEQALDDLAPRVARELESAAISGSNGG